MEESVSPNMRTGIYYIVTNASKHGEFLVGDRIRLLENGDILNLDARGWMLSENIAEATEGMKIMKTGDGKEKERSRKPKMNRGQTMKLTKAMKAQLLEYLRDVQQKGAYWGNKEQFWKRHGKIVKWVEEEEADD